MDNEKHVNEPASIYTPTAYYDVLNRVQRLTPADQIRLLDELASLARRQVVAQTQRSILELRGLGKEIWQGTNAQDYVERERASWNG
jgi:hypothetical protein